MLIKMSVFFILFAFFVVGAQAACTVQTSDFEFGSYQTNSANDSTTTITATCSAGEGYTIDLSEGSSGNYSPRTLVDPSDSDTLVYNLFINQSYSQVWGDGTGATGQVTGTGTGVVETHTVYGQIPANQSVRPGNYSDNITVSLTF